MLVDAVKQGLDCLNVPCTDFGLLSTPQLHYVTAHHKLRYNNENYIKNMTDAYLKFISLCDSKASKNYSQQLVLDCANGVGTVPM